MKYLFVYAIVCVSFFVILLYGCTGVKEIKSISIIRQFTGLESGVKKPEYNLCLTEKDIDNLLRRKDKELGYSPPIMGFPDISNNEMCLFIFMGEEDDDTDALFVELIEEQDRIIFRVAVPGHQKLNLPITIFENPNEPKKVDNIDKSKVNIPKDKTPFGYFVLPKTNKKIILEVGTIGMGKDSFHTVKEFNVK
jgi:hypothetical protein